MQAKREEAKAAVEAAPRKERKTTQEKFDKELEALNEKLTVAKEAVWLTEKFGEGVYQDIPVCARWPAAIPSSTRKAHP